MKLSVYAIVPREPKKLPARGVCGERLSVVDCGEVRAVTGDVEGPPALDETSLRAHDAVVREIAAHIDALLPVRFGTVVPDAAALAGLLDPHASDLADALALVQGREQMTLRVFVEGRPRGLTPVPIEPGPDEAASGPGARYLARLLRAHRAARSVPEIGPLRDALAPLVVAERLEAQERPPLVASVYHLIRRGDAPAYGVVIDRAHRLCPGARVSSSGPWPPWAFVPEVLS
jgi:hypothetical protein